MMRGRTQAYNAFKVIHLFGVILFLDNVIVTLVPLCNLYFMVFKP